MPNIRHILETRVSAAIASAFPEAAGAPAIVQASADPRFGDYQANGAMALAKRLKQKPRDVAGRIIEHLKTDTVIAAMAEAPEIAGPGFINFRLRPEWIAARLGEINCVEAAGDGASEGPPGCAGAGRLDNRDRLGVPPAAKPETVVVDYSAPNLAKEMHVGHLRSTIIGDALARMLEFAGHKVVRQNHVGDWGTQFGMLVAYMQRTGHEPIDDHPELREIEDLYRSAKAAFDSDPEFAKQARQVVTRIQAHDKECIGWWQWLTGGTLQHCQVIYHRLGVTLRKSNVRGESFYNPELKWVVEALRDKRLLTESEGAQCVFLKGEDGTPLFTNKDGAPLPLIVQKSDEGYLYSTTDLAAIRYRCGTGIRKPDWAPADRVLYVVDARQTLHFQMVFECAYQAGFAKRGEHKLIHVAFGTMMDENGRPFKTREGGTVKLMDLLDEAEERAYGLVTEKNPELPEPDRRNIARIVGIGAVKYADLSQNRTSDYVFSWDKMLSLQGNTAPYMQYAYARVRSIFRKGEHDEAETRRDASPIPVPEPAEAALGKALLRFPETLDRALADYRPNVLAAYLYDLAQAFTAFYDACPVLKSDEPTRTYRLKLCDLTARVMQRGLDLLGIETAERM